MSTNPLDQAIQKTESAYTALCDHEAAWGQDTSKIPPGQRERRQRLRTALGNATRATEELQTQHERHEELKALAKDPKNLEHGFGGDWGPATDTGIRARRDPWAVDGDNLLRVETEEGLHARALDAVEFGPGLDDAARDLLTRSVEGDHNSTASAFVLAGLDPAYRTAFFKVIRDPQHGHLLWDDRERAAYARVESSRAAMSEGGSGTYLLPLTLDPQIVLTNSGVASPFRTFADIKTTATNSWQGVKSAGASAEWLPESTVATEGNPTFSSAPIAVHKASVWLTASYELQQDSDISSQLLAVIGDAKSQLENGAFSTGTGSTEPYGLVTRATNTVTSTTASQFGVLDLYALQEALPPRARQGKRPVLVAAAPTINRIRQMDTAGGASFFTDLGKGAPKTVLGLELYEGSGIASAVTTGSKIAVAGDGSKYSIIDRIGTSLVYHAGLIDQATGRPNGTAGWHAFWRTGADVLDAGAFRTLVIK